MLRNSTPLRLPFGNRPCCPSGTLSQPRPTGSVRQSDPARPKPRRTLLPAGWLWSVLLLLGSLPALAQTVVNFNYTGAVQTFVVPTGVTSLSVDAYGAKGQGDNGGSANEGGNGGRVQATLTVTPGQSLSIYVGDRTGFNGGGAGGSFIIPGVINYVGGNGGGATDIRIGGTTLNDRILVAGGGGGAGDLNGTASGGGGDGGNTSGW